MSESRESVALWIAVLALGTQFPWPTAAQLPAQRTRTVQRQGVTAQTATVSPPDAQIATSLHVGTAASARGHDADLFALLLNGANRPVSGAPVAFSVTAQSHAFGCTGTTNAQGRAHCYFSVPMIQEAAEYPVQAHYAGSSSFRPASGTGMLSTTASLRGGLQLDGGAQVSMGLWKGAEGRQGRLRAQVWHQGAPVTTGRVHFMANGVPLGTTVVDGAGLAHLNWTPTAGVLRKFYRETQQDPDCWLGPMQAWYEPPSASPILPGVAVQEAMIGEWDPCAALNTETGQYCEVASATGISYQQSRRGVVRVSQSSFGSGTTVERPQIRLSMPIPTSFPPHPDCEGNAFNQALCVRTCRRLDWVILSPTGVVGTVTRAEGGSDCSGGLVTDVNVDDQIYGMAHDACAYEAARQGRSLWNHSASTSYTLGVLAHHQFYSLRDHVVARRLGTADLSVSLDIQCR